MNEIDKLKTEHARYKKALATIKDQYIATSAAYQYACAALNPPPVTLEELKVALKRCRNWNDLHSINFHSDESGCIRDGTERRVFTFATLREAVDFLTREN